MKRLIFILLCCFADYVCAQTVSVKNGETEKLYAMLKQMVDERKIMFGMANPTTIGFTEGPLNSNYNTSDCKDITGDHPAFHESDFMWYEQDTAFHRYDVVAMKAAWERGAVIGYCWHLKGPHSNSFYAMKNGQKNADYDLASEILSNPDRNTNKILDWYLDRYDKYAIPLFKEIGCPVVFRPFHEMTGEWFWWGAQIGAENYKKLFRLTVDYLRKNGVDNVLYCWAPDKYADFSFYPGDDYVDIIGLDIYEPGLTDYYPKEKLIENLTKICNYAAEHDKVAAWTEVGCRPTDDGVPRYPQQYPDFWTKYVWDILVDNQEAGRVAWVASWYNSDWKNDLSGSPYIPYKGMKKDNSDKAIKDFVRMYDYPSSVFESEMKEYRKRFFDSPEKSKVFDVRDFGAKGDGTTLNTEAIQKAIDKASASNGGMVVVPEGKFLTGSLVMKNNVHLRLEENAVLLGSVNPYHYTTLEPEGAPVSPNSTDNSKLALLLAYGAENFSITGKGTIDGQGRELALYGDSLHHIGERVDSNYSSRMGERFRPKIINFMMCNNVEVRGINIKNSACWVQTYEICRNLVLDGLKVESRAYWNNDGMDITDCRNVKVTNCYVNTADDGICLKSYYPGYYNDSIYIADCEIVTSASAVKFGTASWGGFKNTKIERIKVKDTYRSAIAIEAVDGGFIDGVHVENVVAENTGNAIFIRVGNRRGKPGSIKNVYIGKMKVEVPYEDADINYDMKGPRLSFPHNPIPSSITGIPGNYVENVTIEDIEIVYPGRASKGIAYIPTWRVESVPENINHYPEYSMFGELPSWAFYVRHTKGLKMKNIKVSLKDKDFRPAFVFDDVHDVELDKIDITPKGDNQIFFNK